jgi:hypothetical protein
MTDSNELIQVSCDTSCEDSKEIDTTQSTNPDPVPLIAETQSAIEHLCSNESIPELNACSKDVCRSDSSQSADEECMNDLSQHSEDCEFSLSDIEDAFDQSNEPELNQSQLVGESELNQPQTMSQSGLNQSQSMSPSELDQSQSVSEEVMSQSQPMSHHGPDKVLSEPELNHSQSMSLPEFDQAEEMISQSRAKSDHGLDQSQILSEPELDQSESMSLSMLDQSQVVSESVLTKSETIPDRVPDKSQVMSEPEIDQSQATLETELEQSADIGLLLDLVDQSQSFPEPEFNKPEAMSELEYCQSEIIPQTKIYESQSEVKINEVVDRAETLDENIHKLSHAVSAPQMLQLESESEISHSKIQHSMHSQPVVTPMGEDRLDRIYALLDKYKAYKAKLDAAESSTSVNQEISPSSDIPVSNNGRAKDLSHDVDGNVYASEHGEHQCNVASVTEATGHQTRHDKSDRSWEEDTTDFNFPQECFEQLQDEVL